ncbi:hypothetical protein WOLCODRAFT_154133 [Wolfiporia cocos MD-104 SS10]|uniref:Uncharacterized protein n=1 Tax=Wolfiporia cocos (strain MD-104) TaxID=742152 RepID=A0A2H3JRG9_WOLCO|nr:hypothetical protein WOLCODRAFT_154133 [Wolfiporia cocos MD-104 SS10]
MAGYVNADAIFEWSRCQAHPKYDHNRPRDAVRLYIGYLRKICGNHADARPPATEIGLGDVREYAPRGDGDREKAALGSFGASRKRYGQDDLGEIGETQLISQATLLTGCAPRNTCLEFPALRRCAVRMVYRTSLRACG